MGGLGDSGTFVIGNGDPVALDSQSAQSPLALPADHRAVTEKLAPALRQADVNSLLLEPGVGPNCDLAPGTGEAGS